MEDPKDPDEKLNKLVEAWHAYGGQFAVFVPEEQPTPKRASGDRRLLDP